VNLRRHREYSKQLTAWIDSRARLVVNEMLAQLGIEAGYECRRCHRPLTQKRQDNPFFFECACGHCNLVLGWTMHVCFADRDFEDQAHIFQEAA